MQLLDGDLVVSPKDLVGFAACRHLTRLDHEVALGRRPSPPPADEATQALFRRGLVHERAYLERLRARGARVADLSDHPLTPGRDGLRAAEAATVAAMADGADVVYQATLFDGVWRGHADLLLRRPDRPGRWDWSYDVADTKLSRRPGAAALLQLATYAERVAVLAGGPPEHLVVVTGDGVERAYPFERWAGYARGLRAELEAFVAGPPATDPRPVRYCSRCPWRPQCRARWQLEDRVSLVARIRPPQVRALAEAGVSTLAQLAEADPATLTGPLGSSAGRLVGQAQVQVAERSGTGPAHRLLPPEPARGLALLPPPSPGDVFFDIEGDPYVGDEGLEYLFGVVAKGGYTAFWATEPAGEQAALEALVDHLTAAVRADPEMHVYHYAAYEPTRLRRLAERYGTRVAEVDRLLAAGRLIDLYAVVTQGLQVGSGSYSLKALERYYWGHGRQGPGVGDALGSVAAFERWLTGGPDGDQLLESIRAYNEVDCRSTEALRDWLEGLRQDGGGDRVFDRPALRAVR